MTGRKKKQTNKKTTRFQRRPVSKSIDLRYGYSAILEYLLTSIIRTFVQNASLILLRTCLYREHFSVYLLFSSGIPFFFCCGTTKDRRFGKTTRGQFPSSSDKNAIRGHLFRAELHCYPFGIQNYYQARIRPRGSRIMHDPRFKDLFTLVCR